MTLNPLSEQGGAGSEPHRSLEQDKQRPLSEE